IGIRTALPPATLVRLASSGVPRPLSSMLSLNPKSLPAAATDGAGAEASPERSTTVRARNMARSRGVGTRICITDRASNIWPAQATAVITTRLAEKYPLASQPTVAHSRAFRDNASVSSQAGDLAQ